MGNVEGAVQKALTTKDAKVHEGKPKPETFVVLGVLRG
jgi:hypothetical protein